MGQFRFLHAADIHLDSPLPGLKPYPNCPSRPPEVSTRLALENLVRLAIEKDVQFVVIAGDLYDGKWPDQTTGLFFTSQMTLLRKAGIPVVVIRGNHDAESKITGHLRLPDNVQLLESGKVSKAGNPVFEKLGVEIFGYSYLNQAEVENVLSQFPVANPNRFSIGLLHTSLEGDARHERYIPCSLQDLKNKGYQYWALGHIHKRQVLSEDPWIVFSGNTQGRHIQEPGEKGCYVVDVQSDGQVAMTFCGLDVLRWQSLSIDVSEVESEQSLRSVLAKEVGEFLKSELEESTPQNRQDALHFGLRVTLEGETSLNHQILPMEKTLRDDLQSVLVDLGNERVWLEKLRIKTKAKSERQAVDDGMNPLAMVQKLVMNRGDYPELTFSAKKAMETVLKKVPGEIVQQSSDLGDHQTVLDMLLPKCESILESQWKEDREN